MARLLTFLRGLTAYPRRIAALMAFRKPREQHVREIDRVKSMLLRGH